MVLLQVRIDLCISVLRLEFHNDLSGYRLIFNRWRKGSSFGLKSFLCWCGSRGVLRRVEADKEQSQESDNCKSNEQYFICEQLFCHIISNINSREYIHYCQVNKEC